MYPLLEDETCWFLPVDFDGGSWQDDIIAFGETCRSVGIAVAIERSRSGNGAHAWFFFSVPVSANGASLGCYLITETMTRRHELSMNSYDRLFPNQETWNTADADRVQTQHRICSRAVREGQRQRSTS